MPRRDDFKATESFTDTLDSAITRLTMRRDALEEIYEPNFIDWIFKVGAKVDGRVFEFDTHKYLVQPYADDSQYVVIQKAAQMGFSIRSLLKMLHRSLILAPIKTGYYLPSQPKAAEFSKDRFDSLVRSVPKLDAVYAEGNSSNIHMKQFGASTIFFNYMRGTGALDSSPLDYQVFDEVRLMSTSNIFTATERLSHSIHGFQDYVSTAKYPNSDINYYFNKSCQYEWWVRCPSCGHDFLPHEDFPDKHIENRGTERVPKYGIKCHHCDCWGINAQENGRWIASYPNVKDWAGYHVSQLISDPKYISLEKIMEAYYKRENEAEFWQSKIGVPWIDQQTILARQEHIQACIDTNFMWGHQFPMSASGIRRGFDQVATCMGVDQQQGFCVIVIKEVQPNGVGIIRHLEYHYSEQSFNRCAELMREYDIDVCVVDSEPNWESAIAFCRQFNGRAWMAKYSGTGGGPYVLWGDKIKPGERATHRNLRFPFGCVVDRVTGIEHSLLRFKYRMNRIPNPHALEQEVMARDLVDPDMALVIGGKAQRIPICSALFFVHLQKIAKERESKQDDSGNELVAQAEFKFVHVGLDPHFAHANTYCDMALLRAVRLAKANNTAAEIWYKERPDAPPAPHGGDSFEQEDILEEIEPGIKVTKYVREELDIPPTECHCADCHELFLWQHTRWALRDGLTLRVCINCLGTKKPVEPIQPDTARGYARPDREDAELQVIALLEENPPPDLLD